MKKYELIQNQTIGFVDGRKLYRIRALRDFNDVRAGDIGGYVQSENNLSHGGDCWIYNDAKARDNTIVSDNARMYGNSFIRDNAYMYNNACIHDNACMYGGAIMHNNARMYDNTRMSGDARMCDNSRMSGDARMCDNSRMYGDARMSGDARMCGNVVASHPGHIFTAGGVGSEYGTLTIAHGPSGIVVTRGCFTGTVEEFIEKSKQKHDAETAAEYAELIRIGSARVLRYIEKYPHPKS